MLICVNFSTVYNDMLVAKGLIDGICMMLFALYIGKIKPIASRKGRNSENKYCGVGIVVFHHIIFTTQIRSWHQCHTILAYTLYAFTTLSSYYTTSTIDSNMLFWTWFRYIITLLLFSFWDCFVSMTRSHLHSKQRSKQFCLVYWYLKTTASPATRPS